MLTQRIEAVLNRNLRQSPRAQELCAELAGRRVEVVARSTPWRLVVASDGAALLLSRPAGDSPAPDASVSGTPVALLGLLGSAPEASIQRGDVQIQGDAQIAQRFRELGLLLRPDVEEELSRLIGDTPAFQLMNLTRSVLSWGRQTADTAARNLGEYLAHERRDLVPRAEAAEFLQGVDRLREDVDRLEARIAQLEQRQTEER